MSEQIINQMKTTARSLGDLADVIEQGMLPETSDEVSEQVIRLSSVAITLLDEMDKLSDLVSEETA